MSHLGTFPESAPRAAGPAWRTVTACLIDPYACRARPQRGGWPSACLVDSVPVSRRPCGSPEFWRQEEMMTRASTRSVCTRCRSRGPDARDGRRAASRVAALAATEAAVATRRHASRCAHRGTAGGRARDHQGAPGPPARARAATGVPRQSCRHGASVARSHHGRGARRGPGPSRRRGRCAVDLGRRRGAAFRSDRRTARHGHRGRQGSCECPAAERCGHLRPRRPAIDIARHPGYRQFLVDRPRRRRGGGGLGTGDVPGVPGPCDRLLRLHRRRDRRDLSVRRLRTWHARLRNASAARARCRRRRRTAAWHLRSASWR